MAEESVTAILKAADIAKTIEWYRRVGFEHHTEPAWGPEVREWGTREVGLQDPNGYFLTFTEPA